MHPAAISGQNDPNNTTIFIGNLSPLVTEDDLRMTFLQFGDIMSVKIPIGKACGFVQFAVRESAEQAIEMMNGSVILGQRVRLSWGRGSRPPSQMHTYAPSYTMMTHPSFNPNDFGAPAFAGGYPGMFAPAMMNSSSPLPHSNSPGLMTPSGESMVETDQDSMAYAEKNARLFNELERSQWKGLYPEQGEASQFAA